MPRPAIDMFDIKEAHDLDDFEFALYYTESIAQGRTRPAEVPLCCAGAFEHELPELLEHMYRVAPRALPPAPFTLTPAMRIDHSQVARWMDALAMHDLHVQYHQDFSGLLHRARENDGHRTGIS